MLDYQDALAVLGVGTAHPGGLDSTFAWLREIPWTEGLNVLDVGCGTGRTLLLVQERTKCRAFGVDIRPKMVEKARQRAAGEKQEASFVVGSAEHLPFPDASMDVVYTESVNVFVNPKKSLKEYVRVLKPGGWYVDIEMMSLGPVSDEWKTSAKAVYGAKWVPDLRGWKQMYQEAGFADVRVVASKSVRPEQAMELDTKYPDEMTLTDPEAYVNPEILKVIQRNSAWMEGHYRQLGYGIFLMKRGNIALTPLQGGDA